MKKKVLFPLGLLLLAFSLIHFACQKEIRADLPNPAVTEMLLTNVTGRVVDENQLPVEGATVKAGTSVVTTDINGDFRIDNVLLDKNAGFIKVEKNNYFPGSRTILTKEGATHFVEIELIPQNAIGAFPASVGGIVTVPSGGSIEFPANSVINSSTNTAYSGNVSVAAFFIDPTADNFASIMPGDLRALNVNDEERALQSFGMLAVELTGAGGEALNLAAGKTATLTFPIPVAMAAQAPSTIPLWFFDESVGLWIEEGSATKQGSNYVGTVSHFSFWNVDAPFPLIDFEATIKDQSGSPLKKTRVDIKLTGDEGVTSGSGYTDSTGKIEGKVPAGKALQIVIFNECGTPIYTQNIGPYNSSTNLGTINVNNTGIITLTFTGAVTDCNGASPTNGFVNIHVNDRNYRTNVENGSYSLTITTCADATSAALTAVDLNTNQQSSTQTLAITGNTFTTDLNACGTSTSQYINFTLNGNHSITVPLDSLSGDYWNQATRIKGYTINSNPYKYVYLGFAGAAAVGSYPLSELMIVLDNQTFTKEGTTNVNITEYGTVNQFIEGNFTGTVRDSLGTGTYPVTLNFRVKRR